MRLFKPSPRCLERPKGLIDALLHGSDGGQTTYSKKMAREKSVIEFEFHRVKPQCMGDYQRLINEFYPRWNSQKTHASILRGSFVTSIGELDKGIHMWQFDGYAGYTKAQKLRESSSEYQEFYRELSPLLNERWNQICLEFAFWACSPPKFSGGIYELRSYQLKPGRMLEWESHWRKGLEVRRQFCEPVGAWFNQLGNLNLVHHMWVYPDLEARKVTREKAWSVEGWPQTVYNTVRLIKKMEATIMKPLESSPLQ